MNLLSIIPQLFKLGDKLIVDQDKKIEYAFKMQELTFKAMETMLSTSTVPWVDALVKILYALKTLFRPILGALMTAFGAYAHVKGIEISPTMHAVFDGAFPAWGISRHVSKNKPNPAPDFDDD